MFKEILNLINIKEHINNFIKNRSYKKSFKVDLERLFDDYDKKFQKIIDEILKDAKKRLLKDKKFSQLEKEKGINTISNFEDNNLEKINNIFDNFPFKESLKLIFYNGTTKEEIENLEIKINTWYSILDKQMLNYFNSKDVDIKLLNNEKKKIISILNNYFINLEEDIGTKLVNLTPMIMSNNIIKGQSEQNEKLFRNIEMLINDINKGTMKKYYKEIVKILDNLLDDIINLIKK